MNDDDLMKASVEQPQSDLQIDWSQEPLSDRERTIRAVLLRKATTTTPGFEIFSLRCLLNKGVTVRLEPKNAASDFGDAYVAAEASVNAFLRSGTKLRMKDVIREVDDQQASQ